MARALQERGQPAKQPIARMVPRWVPIPTWRRYRAGIREMEDLVEEVVAVRESDGRDRRGGRGRARRRGRPLPARVLPVRRRPRRCIGEQFALVEGKLILATLIQRYHLEPLSDPDIDLSVSITTRPLEPIEMRVEGRNR